MKNMRLKIPGMNHTDVANHILYSGKCHLEDVEPRLTGDQLGQIYDILASTILETKKEYERR